MNNAPGDEVDSATSWKRRTLSPSTVDENRGRSVPGFFRTGRVQPQPLCAHEIDHQQFCPLADGGKGAAKRVFQMLYQMCFPYLKLHSSKNFAVDLSKYYLGHTQYLLFCCICCIRDYYPWIININCDHGKHCMIPEQAKQL